MMKDNEFKNQKDKKRKLIGTKRNHEKPKKAHRYGVKHFTKTQSTKPVKVF
uniref:Uncharacterized protein n=1 Tax=Rhizophora mucronata TaxID=61149 RepID=A0A2P2R0G7_RHIMU